MNKVVKAQLKLEETRKALGGLLDTPEEQRAEDFQDKLETAKRAVQSAQSEVLAAGLAEPEVPEHRQNTSEGAELRSMLDRANMGEAFAAILERRSMDGVLRELQEHFDLAPNQVPLAMLETRAVTPAPADVGQNQQPIIPYVFPRSVAAFLGVAMPTVGVGEQLFPVLTSELAVRTPAESAAAAETTGSFSADVLRASRLQASFRYTREDRASFAGMDESLRENLSMGLSDGLDKQIVAGTNGLLTGTNLANHNVNAVTTFDDYIEDFAYGRVDGRYAATAGEVRAVVGSATYAHAGKVYRNANVDRTALDRLMEITGGVRVSAHVPAVASNKQNSIIRLGQNRDMVAPLWQGVTIIPDEVTKADEGEIKITAVLLHAVKILRTDGFYKQQTQHA